MFFEEPPQDDDIFEYTLEQLLQVEIIVAGKKVQKLNEAPAIVSVYTGTELQQMGVINLYEALNYIPGVTVTETYFGYSSVEFRGVKQTHYNNKSLLLINNHPVFNAAIGSFYLEQIPLNMVERIEVIRGPGSTLYGTNAYAGVIKVITYKGKQLNGKTEIEVMGGSHGTLQTGLLYGQEWGDFQLSTALSYGDSTGYDYHVEADEEGIAGTIDYENDYSNGLLSMSYKNLCLNVGFFSQKKDKFGTVTTLASTGERHLKGFSADLNYHFNLTEKLRFDLAAYYDWIKKKEDIDWFPPYQVLKEMGIGEKEEMRYSGTKSSIEVQGNYEFSDDTHLLAGFLYEYQHSSPYIWYVYGTDIISPFDSSPYLESQNSYDVSGYMQLDTVLWDTLGVVGGVRLTHNKDYGSKVVPRSGLVYNPMKGLSIKLLYGKAFRNPGFLEKYSQVNKVLLGNIDLLPEEIETLDMGVDILINKYNSLRINYFHTVTDNLITRSLIVPTGMEETIESTLQYVNSQGETFNGVEVEWKGSSIDNMRYYFNASYVTGKERADSSDVLFIPKWQAVSGVTWKPHHRLTLSTQLKYTGKRKGFLFDGQPSVTDEYLLWNMSVQARISPRLTLQLIGKNIGDSNYHYPEYIRRRIAQTPGGPGRSIYFKVIYTLM